ncbi:metallophosphoesterase family protein [Sporolactobacillus pectinivorans]|uniref:metallophosphoesterase family protein n=1 Tax=Sporolactobacillus pectinivorans TaxID=1591408 RepID=UPI000C260458|nr:metallophosphoesterase family protein [Sporolactobacillus pectinivorans]
MKHRIGLLSDVHGNITALEAVIADSIQENVTDYWFLGDLIMPGPGSGKLFDILETVNLSAFVKGNWEDCFLEVLSGDIDTNDPTDIYIAKLAQYQCQNLSHANIEFIKRSPLYLTKTINGLKFGISHNLPEKDYGTDLTPDQDTKNFDQLFTKEQCDIAIYAHIHHQMIRYSSNDELIINPGSIGQPFFKWDKLRADRRAQYAIIEVDENGLFEVDFKKVRYDVERETQRAIRYGIPYLNLYKELLKTGYVHTHDKELLLKINRQNDYKEDVIIFFNEKYRDTRN